MRTGIKSSAIDATHSGRAAREPSPQRNASTTRWNGNGSMSPARIALAHAALGTPCRVRRSKRRTSAGAIRIGGRGADAASAAYG